MPCDRLAVVTPLPNDRNPAAVYIASLVSPTSRRVQRQALNTIAGMLTGTRDALACPWAALRYQHAQAVRTALAARYRPATVNRALAALRGTLREAWRLGLMSAEDLARAIDVKPVRGSTLPAGRSLTAGELQALFAACERDRRPVSGARDAALLALLYAGGLRRAEAVALDLADYDAESGAVTIRAGKGRKARTAYLAAGARAALADWLAHRGSKAGALLHPINKAGRMAPRRLTDQAVRDVVARRAAQARVAKCSPHDLRRTFVGDLLDAGADLASVQQLAGHASPTTTSRYDRRGERAKQKAGGLLHVPYRERSR